MEYKVSDKECMEAMKTLRAYCQERLECEECTGFCAELKRGISPCPPGDSLLVSELTNSPCEWVLPEEVENKR